MVCTGEFTQWCSEKRGASSRVIAKKSWVNTEYYRASFVIPIDKLQCFMPLAVITRCIDVNKEQKGRSMTILLIGLFIFIGIHIVPSLPGMRSSIVNSIGLNTYRVIYSLIVVTGLFSIIYGFIAARQEDLFPLYITPFWMRHLAMTLMLPVFILVFAKFIRGNIAKWTKDPVILAVKIWAISHLLVNGEPYSVALFSGFLVWAIWARISLKKFNRKNTDVEEFPHALRNDTISVGLGILLYGLFIWKLHEILIGMAILT